MLAMALLLALAQADFEQKLDSMIPRLKAETPAERDAASRELRDLAQSDVPAARKVLRRRLESERDAEIQSRLRDALKSLPVFDVSLALEGEARVGKPVTLKVRVRNVSDEKQNLVRCLDGSSSGRRFPQYVSEVLPPGGKSEKSSEGKLCSTFNPLLAEDILPLQPGEEIDPYTSSAVSAFLKGWTPNVPGTYRVTLRCNFDAPEPAAFDPSQLVQKAWPELARVPHVRFEGSIDVVVKP